MSGKGRYLKLAPGQKCLRCGADNSYRAAGTKWCYACSKELSRLRDQARRDYHKALSARDEANIAHECCKHQYTYGFTFCSICGQRLRGRGGYEICEEEF